MKLKLLAVSFIVLCLVGLAIFQVLRSFGSTRDNPTASLMHELTVETRFKDYNDGELRSSADTLERELNKQVSQELNGLMSSQRPSESQIKEIASAFARFLVLRRTATREEYIEQVDPKPSSGLTDENTQSADEVWQYNSAWARHADIPVDSIRVAPMFIRGVPVGDFEPRGTRVLRPLSNGKFLLADTVGGYSVYQVLIDMTIPSIDASEEFDITLGTMLINDGPKGEWSPVANEFIGVPQGKVVFVPSP